MATTVGLVIFDCDGVLVDSERLAVRVEARLISELGWPLTEADVLDRFGGRSDAYMLGDRGRAESTSTRLARPLPAVPAFRLPGRVDCGRGHRGRTRPTHGCHVRCLERDPREDEAHPRAHGVVRAVRRTYLLDDRGRAGQASTRPVPACSRPIWRDTKSVRSRRGQQIRCRGGTGSGHALAGLRRWAHPSLMARRPPHHRLQRHADLPGLLGAA